MSLLPPNSTALERALEAGAADPLAMIPVPLRELWNPRTCPSDLLPWLAFGLSIDTWDAAWPEDVKRARITQAIAVQRRKGTASAVRAVVAAFHGQIALREWWQTTPAGDPYTFSLILALDQTAGAASSLYVDQIIDEVSRTKPVRAHFTFTQAIESAAEVGVVGALRAFATVRLQLAA